METPRLGVVLDASAVIALLLEEPGAETVGVLLGSAEARMATMNAAEVIDVLTRVRRGRPDTVIARIEELLSTVVEPVVPSLELAIRAGELRARNFRRDQRISLADCFALATAEPGDRIVTGDSTLASVARDEGIETILLVP